MRNLQEVKSHFNQEGTQTIANEVAGYQFVKRADGVMFQFTEAGYKFYNNIDSLCRAALGRIKKG